MNLQAKIDRLEVRLLEAKAEQRRQCQWVGERFGAIAATKAAERVTTRIVHQIEQLKFSQHNAGACDEETCSDCSTNKYAPYNWPARGANISGAKLTYR